eukprot:3013315-Prymnesium_polylepis.1
MKVVRLSNGNATVKQDGAQVSGGQVVTPVGIDVATLRAILGDDEVNSDDDEFLQFINNDTTFGGIN